MPKPEGRRGAVIGFVAVPGLGKTSLSQRIASTLYDSGTSVEVYTADDLTDAKRRTFWQDVGPMAIPPDSKEGAQQETRLVIADRNLLDTDSGTAMLSTSFVNNCLGVTALRVLLHWFMSLLY